MRRPTGSISSGFPFGGEPGLGFEALAIENRDWIARLEQTEEAWSKDEFAF